MPFHKSITIKQDTILFLWKITESYDWFFENAKLKEKSILRLETMKSESHRKGFLAVRMLLQNIGYSDFDLFYDEYGKPHLHDGRHISISHSNDFSAVVISNEILGLDIEQIKEKTLKIAPRFMEMHHLENLEHEDRLKKATVIWGIKESIFKIKNEKGTLGWATYKVGKAGDAAQLIEDATKRMPDLPVFRYHLGMSYLAMNKPDAAKKELQKALTLGEGKDFLEAEQVKQALKGL